MNAEQIKLVFILLTAGIFFATLAHRIGFGSVLGYLLAGLLIGPSGLGLIKDSESLMHFSEFGVVFFLFLIGLELEPKRLWSMRAAILGLGPLQYFISMGLLIVIFLGFKFEFSRAFVFASAAALSSTAIALQMLKDKNLLPQKSGQSGFGILLFQDLIVIPLLILLPLLSSQQISSQQNSFAIWQIVLVLAGVVLASRYLVRRIFMWVASSHLREVFTSLCLLFVIGLAVLMSALGASMALGAFLGGVLLANSEFKHAIETDIEPFKGLLLGLFFMSVGMSLEKQALLQNPLLVLGLLVTLLAVKILVLFGLATFFKIPKHESPFFALVLSQAGEFAFVLFGLAHSLALITGEDKTIFSAVVALSMMTTPLLILGHDFLNRRRQSLKVTPESDVVNDHPQVIIAGFGRVGQIIARLMFAQQIKTTVLDHDPDQIELVRRFGFKIYFGDAARLDLLHTAGASEAKILVVAVDDVETSLKIIDLVKEHFPHLKIVARARNVTHVYSLLDRGVTLWERETFDSSIKLGEHVLKILGMRPFEAHQAGLAFRKHNVQSIRELYTMRSDQRQLVTVAKQARDDIAQLFEMQNRKIRSQHHGWERENQTEEPPKE